ncbi:hypothetical protein TOPH_02189 [Tolypocladium ophioglossoides CBS 100239]|uniref:Uncharacterized protein n=1 Tax=Tolypocladium ophioglossoides (strain CBS 100239) TaxID=1163406 RepID=A0A0L0NFK9_TOLOC|nr:hypothetical protein TOPH_02189 [Tolypocladium ophioglossoides CBS 100239]
MVQAHHSESPHGAIDVLGRPLHAQSATLDGPHNERGDGDGPEAAGSASAAGGADEDVYGRVFDGLLVLALQYEPDVLCHAGGLYDSISASWPRMVARSRLGHDIADGPDVLRGAHAHILVDVDIPPLVEEIRRQERRVGHEARRREVQVCEQLLAARQHHPRLAAIAIAIAIAIAGVDLVRPDALPHVDAELAELALDAAGRGVAADELRAGVEQDDRLGGELVLDLRRDLDAGRAAARDDDVRRGADARGGGVQAGNELVVRAGRLPGHARLRGVGARRDDEVVIRDAPLAVRSRRRDAHRLGQRVEPRRGAEDELDAAGGVLRQPRRDGLQELLVLDDAGDDGAHGGDGPVEVAVLRERQTGTSWGMLDGSTAHLGD